MSPRTTKLLLNLGIASMFVLMSGVVSAQQPELIMQTGHSSDVWSISISPDGKLLLSGADDETVKLWDLSAKRELRTFRGNGDGAFCAVAFLPDSKTFVSGTTGGTITWWDVTTGRKLNEFTKRSRPLTRVILSPDGTTIASIEDESPIITIRSILTGKEVRTFVDRSSFVFSIAFSPDGKRPASGNKKGEIVLWDVEGNKGPRILTGHRSYVWSIAWSPDAKMLASGSWDSSIRLWRLEEAEEEAQPITLLGHEGRILCVVFSPDGRTLASSGSDKTIRIWTVLRGQDPKVMRQPSEADALAFSPEGSTLAALQDNDNAIILWEVSGGRELDRLRGHTYDIAMLNVIFSPDGKIMATANKNTIKLWDIATGRGIRTLFGHTASVFSIAFSPDGKTLASGSADKTLKLWDLDTGAARSFGGFPLSVLSVAFSPDGKKIAGCGGSVIKLWDPISGAELRTIENAGMADSIAFSPDGRILASCGLDATIRLWDLEKELPPTLLRGYDVPVNRVRFSRDGKTLVSRGEQLSKPETAIRTWDVTSGKETKAFDWNDPETEGLVEAIAPDFYQDYVRKLTPDSRFRLRKGENGKLNIHETKSDALLVSLIAVDDDDWLVTTPDGLFDGTPSAWKKIRWRFNNNTFDHAAVEAFYNDYFHPGLLPKIMAGEHPRAPADLSQKDRRPIPVTIKPAQPIDLTQPITSRIMAVQVTVTEVPTGPDISDKNKQWPRSGARDVRLFRNGSLVKSWTGDLFDPGAKGGCKLQPQKSPQEARRSICSGTVTLVAGENTLTAYAFNTNDVKSEDATLTVSGADTLKRGGTLYVLAIGVNHYENKDFNLVYAVPDAEDFSAELKRQQEKLTNYQRTEIIALYNEQATKQRILRTLSELAAKVQPEDAVVVYFAGHGTAGSCLSQATQQVNAKDRFYLVPHDLGYKGAIPNQCEQPMLDEVARHSISDLDLEAAFQKLDAGQLLLVIDACNSGQALESEEKRRGPMNSKGLAQLAYEKGMYVLTAAQSFQEAKADKKIAQGHGYLTYALIEEAIRQKKAVDKNGNVFLRDWVDYAVQRVPLMQQAEGAERREFVKKKTASTNNNEEEIQTPRVFYRREPDLKPLVVARP